MDTLSPPKEQITLMGFSPKLDGRSLRGNRTPKSNRVKITVNGTTLTPEDCHDVSSEKVTLIGFNRSDSFHSNSGTIGHSQCKDINPPKMEKLAEVCEKQERLTRLTEETREWFNKMHTEKESWRNEPFDDASERMQQFFAEAKEKFTKCSQDLFDQFVQENQDRFTQMLELSEFLRKNYPPSRPSNFHQNFESFQNTSSKHQSSNGTYDSDTLKGFPKSPNMSESNWNDTLGRDSGIHTSHPPSPKSPHLSQTPHHTPSSSKHYSYNENKFPSFSNCPSFRSTFTTNGDTNTNNQAGPNRQFNMFSSFPTFPSFPVMTVPSPNHSPFMGRASGAYQMSSSKSTFEYCGDTNSYRFSTEQISQSYDQSFEAVSESDDEEDEESSTTGEPSECGDETSTAEETENSSSSPQAQEGDNKHERINNALLKIATELLHTERTYVNILYLIDQVFQFRVDNDNRAHNMFPQEVITQMFSNIKSIYKLHHDFLLPQLEQRMSCWEDDRKIGDIMKNFAPFLKMYTEYVKNFDNAMNTINFWVAKQPKFSSIVEAIQRMPECGNLTLQHHMLSPVQRVPRYELLLRDYLKKLPEDSPDRSDTEKALHLVSTAANHSNDAMKKIDKFKKLLEIQDMIGGSIDLVSPTRELIMEGKIIKISARSGDHQERQLFLFSDLLLLCSQRLISNRVVSGPVYRVRARLAVDGLQVLEGDNLETANTFYIRDNQKTIELYTQTPEDKEEWMQALCRAIQDLYKRKSSLKIGIDPSLIPETDLGKRPPTLLKMDTINSCMSCKSQFTAFRRRHHCRACGQVVCHKCSVHKVPIAYDDDKLNRVCNHCHKMLSAQSPVNENEECEKENIESPIQRKGVLEVKATDDSVISSYLLLKTRGKTWIKRWFSLHTDFVLYSFKGNEDRQAMTSTPVPGLTVALPAKSDNIDREHVFKLFHKKKVYYFQAKDHTELKRWMSALEKASKAELPM